MMKNLKKSEIVVYVVALMLVTAGYFNYTASDSNELIETYSEDVQKLEDTANTGVGDAVLVSNNNTNNDEGNNQNIENASNSIKKEDKENVTLVDNDNQTFDNKTILGNKEQTEESSSESNENVYDATNNTNQVNDTNTTTTVNTSVDTQESNYYANSKLEREKMYASMISTYQNILNNNNVSETQKSIASKEITKINNTKNSIMICENLIMTKGFDNCVILINENSVNVVVNIKNGLTPDKVAQIQNVVSREIGTDVENIHIMEK